MARILLVAVTVLGAMLFDEIGFVHTSLVVLGLLFVGLHMLQLGESFISWLVAEGESRQLRLRFSLLGEGDLWHRRLAMCAYGSFSVTTIIVVLILDPILAIWETALVSIGAGALGFAAAVFATILAYRLLGVGHYADGNERTGIEEALTPVGQAAFFMVPMIAVGYMVGSNLNEQHETGLWPSHIMAIAAAVFFGLLLAVFSRLVRTLRN